jgi:hypothetical protein
MNLQLPHWAQLSLGLAVVVITWFLKENTAGALTLPAVVVTVLTATLTVIGLLTDSALKKTPPSSGSDKGASGGPVSSHEEITKPTLVKRTSLLAGFTLFAFLALLPECTSTGQVSPVVVDITQDSLQLIGCAIPVFATGTETSPVNWVQIALNLATTCGADVTEIANLFGASSQVAQAAVANSAQIHAAATAYKAKLSR